MQKLAMLRLAVTILCVAGLTACGQDRPRLAPVPVDLTTCAPEPEAPSLPAQDWTSIAAAQAVQMVRDALTLDYALNLRSAYGSCKSKVDGVAAWNRQIAP